MSKFRVATNDRFTVNNWNMKIQETRESSSTKDRKKQRHSHPTITHFLLHFCSAKFSRIACFIVKQYLFFFSNYHRFVISKLTLKSINSNASIYTKRKHPHARLNIWCLSANNWILMWSSTCSSICLNKYNFPECVLWKWKHLCSFVLVFWTEVYRKCNGTATKSFNIFVRSLSVCSC